MKNKINPRPIVLAAMILAVGIYRLFMANGSLGTLANFTPLGAMALFGGCYYNDKWKAYLVPLLTLWLTDIILNRFVFFNQWVFFYNGFIWVYASFALMVLVGSFIRNVSLKSVIIAGIVGALSHWLISDIGIWLNGGCVPVEGPYIPTLKNFIQAMQFGWPSMYKLLAGNLMFAALLFGGFELMQRKFPILQLRTSYQ